MELRQIEYVVGAIDHGGFTRAARALHVTQPALSEGIARLEAELGVALFDRVGRRVMISAAGEAFLEPARRLLRDRSVLAASVAAVIGLDAGSDCQTVVSLRGCARGRRCRAGVVCVDGMDPDRATIRACRGSERDRWNGQRDDDNRRDEGTPTTWRRAPAGLLSGPNRLKIVRKPSCWRIGETCRMAPSRRCSIVPAC